MCIGFGISTLTCFIRTFFQKLYTSIFKRSEKVGFFGLMGLAILVIFLKGSSTIGQQGLFASVLNPYVEETSASVISAPSAYQMTEMNSLSASGVNRINGVLELDTIQGNSLAPRSQILADVSNDDPSDRGNRITSYEVQEGDSVSLIASDYGVSVNTIIWANKLTNIDQIKAGMVIKIPPVSGVIHTVKSGDTVSKIAKLYGADVDEIMKFNDIPTSGDLAIGDEIVVPNGEITKVITKATSGTAAYPTADASRFAHLPAIAGYFAAPTTGTDWGIIHGRNGVDIANTCGTAVYASADGDAAIVSVPNSTSPASNGGYGNYIKLVHANGTETLYGHLMKVLVDAGSTIAKGQLIALMGGRPGMPGAGHSTGCHLHFEVHGAANPMAK